uniref:Uncharacterized protein LOC111117143 n=1 Tax=Crassostrea virginica TaxID=6565 RepID=A0A8B8C863_CRAVI|nr:uncharacterized protein LOC111117143 [Crassostrea virginica]
MKEIRLIPSGIPRWAGVEDLLTLLSSPVIQKSLSVSGVNNCLHISCVTPDRVWVSDEDNIILTDTATGKQLHSVEDPLGLPTGIHTVNCQGELIYICKEFNIIKLCNDMKTTTTLIKHTDTTWEPQCVYCSPSSGDLLIGMCREDTDTYTCTGKVMRDNNTGKYKQTIPHNDNTPHTLYRDPRFITENNNGDVLLSDLSRRAVVVTSVQMLDRDGQFLSYVLTRYRTPGMNKPWGLSYDVTTHVVYVGSGSYNNNTMSLCRYINRHLHLADEREHDDDFDEEQTQAGM